MLRILKQNWVFSLAIAMPFLLYSAPVSAQSLVINEVMSNNLTGLADEDGERQDWIEIYNRSDQPQNLNGFGLSDNRNTPLKWIFPDITMQPGDYLTIFASGKNRVYIANHNESIFAIGDDWSYRLGISEPPEEWKNIGFDDSGWQTAPSGFGYGDDDDSTLIDQTVSLYLRGKFDYDGYGMVYSLLHIDYDDAYVAYLNGEEIGRSNIGTVGTPPEYFDQADGEREARMYRGFLPETIMIHRVWNLIQPGENVLTIQVHNDDPFSDDFTAIPFFTMGMYGAPDSARGISEIVRHSLPINHSNFRVSAGDESIYLSHWSGDLLDRVKVPPLPPDVSYGRPLDGSESFVLFAEPTPGTDNFTPGRLGFSDPPIFSHESGLYNGQMSVVLSGDSLEQVIYYTLDGTLPDENSTLFSDSLTIDSTTVIRAVSIIQDYLPSEIVTKTYIFNYNSDFPVISLVTEPDNLWDEDRGIYVLGRNYEPEPPNHGANFWEDWEIPAHIDFIEANGQLGFEMNVGVKIHGGWTRFFPQKSLAIFARTKYGDDVIKYPIFPNRPYDEYQSFLLRNGGSDWNHAMIRDPLILGLMEDRDVDIQAYRPAIVYINGVYWGIHNIREKTNEHFIASLHDEDPEMLDIVNIWGIAIEGDTEHYDLLLDFVENNDLTDSTNYDLVKQMIDVNNFIDYNIVNIFVDNTDWPGNNNKFWRPHRPGGKWRWFLYDTDFGFGLRDTSAYRHNTMAMATDPDEIEWPNPAYSTLLLRRLLTSNDFKVKFINRFSKLMNTNFTTQNMLDSIQSMQENLSIDMESHMLRWDRSFDSWLEDIEEIKRFVELRPEYIRRFVEAEFNLPGSYRLTVNAEPFNAGLLTAGGIPVDSNPWSGTFFGSVPIKMKADPFTGYLFSHWSGISWSPESRVEIILGGDTDITATFDQASDFTGAVIINEISFANSNEFNSGDWIEIYAVSGDHELGGSVISDENRNNRFTIPAGINISAGEHLIFAQDTVLFREHFGSEINIVGNLNFGFRANGDMVKIIEPSGIIIDLVEYDNRAPWPLSPDSLDRTLELIDPTLPNELAESWRISLSPHGSPGMGNDYDYPAAFSLVQPEINGVLESDTVSFHWSRSGVNHPQLTHTYTIDISQDSSFSSYLSHTISDTFIVVDSLGGSELTSQYYWRVKSVNSLDMVTYAGENQTNWSFTIDYALQPPKTFVLEAPYPNPFNNSTRIDFGLPFSGEVKFVIYDLAGRTVGNIGGNYQAGRHFFYFPRHSNVEFLSSGIYFITAQYADEILTRKLVYLK